MRLRRVAVLGCVAVALASAAGCGLSVDALPQPIPSDEVPPAILVPTSTVVNPGQHGGMIPFSGVYFIAPDGTQLVKTTQWVHPKITPQKLLDTLDSGPSSAEFDEGIQSALPPNASLLSGGVTNGVLAVYLDVSYESLFANQEGLYFAQIVWTATSLPEIKSLVFYFNNAAVSPVTGNGAIATAYLVDRCDYQELAPPKTPSTCPTH